MYRAVALVLLVVHFSGKQLLVNSEPITYPPPINSARLFGQKWIHFENQTFHPGNFTQTIDIKKFGFKLHFNPHTTLEPVTITVGVTLQSPHHVVPKGTTLVSALYTIETSKELLKPVTVEIEHSVNINRGSRETLMFARAGNGSSDYEKLHGGRFDRKYWGTIKLSKLGMIGVFTEEESDVTSIDYWAKEESDVTSIDYWAKVLDVEKADLETLLNRENVDLETFLERHSDELYPLEASVAPSDTLEQRTDLERDTASIDYLAHLLGFRHKGTDGLYSLALVASRKLNIINQLFEKDWVEIMTPFSFTFVHGSEKLTLHVNKEGIRHKDWDIQPKIFPPEISRSAIDSHGLSTYEFSVSWTGFGEQHPLQYFMDVEGISRDSFLIFINPHEIGEIGTNHPVKRRRIIEDFRQLYSAVAEIGDWEGLCMNLGADRSILNDLKYSSIDIRSKKRECLEALYYRDDIYWEDVVKAVGKYPISNRRVVKEIIERYKLKMDLSEIDRASVCTDKQCNS